MDFNDTTLECQDPQHDENTNSAPREFPFTAEEARFYAEKGFDQPRRCPACRAAKKTRFNSSQRSMHDAVCASCGRQTQVPFEPRGDRPVYCDDCFRQMKQSMA
jgi:CxxC-x17-CxxC domain-containing protein